MTQTLIAAATPRTAGAKAGGWITIQKLGEESPRTWDPHDYWGESQKAGTGFLGREVDVATSERAGGLGLLLLKVTTRAQLKKHCCADTDVSNSPPL